MATLRDRLLPVPAYWLGASAFVGGAALLGHLPAASGRPDGWRAVVGPALLVFGQSAAAAMLWRSTRGWRLAALALGVQTIAISAGPVAYRLIAGPFVGLSASAAGWQFSAGVDAHLLWIVGAGNQVPTGLSVNVAALAMLAVLGAAWPVRGSATGA